MKQMQIKVNGLCHADDIRRVAHSGADYVGMQFGKGKPHRMVMLQRSTGTLPDMAEADFSSLSSEGAGRALSLVGMLSGESAQSVITAVYSYGLDAVQFDDDCGAVFIRNLVGTVVPDICPHLDIIKHFHVSCADDFAACRQYEELASRFIFRFDADALRGISWDAKAHIADAYHGTVPFLVSCPTGESREAMAAFSRNAAFCGLDLEPDNESLTIAQYMQKVHEIVVNRE